MPFQNQTPTPPFFPPGKQIIFVTNNSTKSRAEYQEKLQAMGIPAEVVRGPPLPLPLIHPDPLRPE